jgi:lipopolysaccharide transport system permease protein
LGTVSIKQNIHLVKNVILPIDLIPARMALMSLVTQLFGFSLVFVLSAINGSISFHLLFLPIALFVQTMFLFGLVWVFAAMGVMVLDLGYFVNIFLLLLLFLSPIAFQPDMLSPGLWFLVDFNPIYYMTELFRFSLIGNNPWKTSVMCIAGAGSAMTFVFGCLFFRQFKNILVDYE